MTFANVLVDGAAVGQARAMKFRAAGAGAALNGAPAVALHFVADAVSAWAPLASGGKVLISVMITTSDVAGQPFVIYELKGATVTGLDNRWTSGGSPSVDVRLAYSALRIRYKDGATLDMPPSG